MPQKSCVQHEQSTALGEFIRIKTQLGEFMRIKKHLGEIIGSRKQSCELTKIKKQIQLDNREIFDPGGGTVGSILKIKNLQENSPDLYSPLKKLIPEHQERLKKLKSEHGNVQLGNITVDVVLGGMREMTGLLWKTSLLDLEEGIHFRGLSIPECQRSLAAAKSGGKPLPEGLLWLLLIGKVSTKEQVDALSKELQGRAAAPDHASKAIIQKGEMRNRKPEEEEEREEKVKSKEEEQIWLKEAREGGNQKIPSVQSTGNMGNQLEQSLEPSQPWRGKGQDQAEEEVGEKSWKAEGSGQSMGTQGSFWNPEGLIEETGHLKGIRAGAMGRGSCTRPSPNKKVNK